MKLQNVSALRHFKRPPTSRPNTPGPEKPRPIVSRISVDIVHLLRKSHADKRTHAHCEQVPSRHRSRSIDQKRKNSSSSRSHRGRRQSHVFPDVPVQPTQSTPTAPTSSKAVLSFDSTPVTPRTPPDASHPLLPEHQTRRPDQVTKVDPVQADDNLAHTCCVGPMTDEHVLSILTSSQLSPDLETPLCAVLSSTAEPGQVSCLACSAHTDHDHDRSPSPARETRHSMSAQPSATHWLRDTLKRRSSGISVPHIPNSLRSRILPSRHTPQALRKPDTTLLDDRSERSEQSLLPNMSSVSSSSHRSTSVDVAAQSPPVFLKEKTPTTELHLSLDPLPEVHRPPPPRKTEALGLSCRHHRDHVQYLPPSSAHFESLQKHVSCQKSSEGSSGIGKMEDAIQFDESVVQIPIKQSGRGLSCPHPPASNSTRSIRRSEHFSEHSHQHERFQRQRKSMQFVEPHSLDVC